MNKNEEAVYFAYRFACDYANNGSAVLAVCTIVQGKVTEIIHPADPKGLSDVQVDDGDILAELLEGEFWKKEKKIIYAIGDEEVLRKLLGLGQTFVTTDDTWCEFQTMCDDDHDNAVFRENGIDLVFWEDERLIEMLKAA